MTFLIKRYIVAIATLSFCLPLQYCKTIQPPAPDLVYAEETEIPKISEVRVPLEISQQSIEESVNRNMKELLYEDNQLEDHGGDNLLLKVWKQERVTIKITGGEIHYRVPVKIWAKAGFKFKKFGIAIENFQEIEGAIALQFKSLVSIDSNWQIKTHTTLANYQWLSKPHLKFGGFKLPITIIADRILETQKEKISKAIDAGAAKSLDLKRHVEEIWRKIQQPIRLSDHPPLWMLVNPKEIYIEPLKIQGGKIFATMGMLGIVRTTLENKEQQHIISLPALQFRDSSTSSISIALNGEVSYETATKLLEEQLTGGKYIFRNGRKKVVIKKIELYPLQN